MTEQSYFCSCNLHVNNFRCISSNWPPGLSDFTLFSFSRIKSAFASVGRCPDSLVKLLIGVSTTSSGSSSVDVVVVVVQSPTDASIVHFRMDGPALCQVEESIRGEECGGCGRFLSFTNAEETLKM
jgi:hypothetical protein